MKRIHIVLLLLLAFTSQAVAVSALPCQMMAPVGNAVRSDALEDGDMAATGHAGHHMPADSGAEPAGAAGGCCEGGLCSMSHCQSAPGLPLDHSGNRLPVFSFHSVAFESGAPLHPVDSLYRPPISR
jgi:hypothetical protein